MSFPYHDRAWFEAAGVLLARLRDDDTVLAPDRFWWALPVPVQRWVSANFTADARFDWAVIHKGELAWVPRRFLERLQREMTPAFANDVFVILGPADRGLTLVTPDENHLRSFTMTVDGLSEDPIPDNPYEADRAIGAAPSIEAFGAATPTHLRAMQEQFFDDGGYEYPTRRDQAYHQDVRELAEQVLRRWAGRDVLDVACASSAAGVVEPGTRLVRFDLSERGVRTAAAADADQTGIQHAAIDAHDLPFPDQRFDGVMFIDAIEHVRDAGAVLAEIARVLRPGGEVFLTYANRNSVNQIVNQALGYPPFATNHQHIQEFTPDEIAETLVGLGLEIVETGGVSMYPYWGIPGVDDLVRHVTDDDEAVVEMFRFLGKAAGDRYAYTGTALARKVPLPRP
ncbi:methyltransferase domain-containing protein [Actinospongicola halichondriae]|uniref:methyltransferase domain-containing protein n=1 Tax=Actinospongicola halichondriae TaxID=3236844 RepID=UPI003D46827A